MIIPIIFVYLALVILVGSLSHRLFRGTGEDYFVATRSIGPFILLMSLFGTNMTAFALLGASGEAYHEGIGVFSLMASSSALIIPSVFFFVGTRLWAIGKREGYITQVQYFRARWGSDRLGLLLFVVLVGLVVPYLLIGVMAGGVTLNQVTDGQIPEWLGGMIICLVVLTYVSTSGLRATAWVNTFQTLVFMILGAVAFVVITRKLGGLSQGLERVMETHPELLIRGEHIKPLQLLTYHLHPPLGGDVPAHVHALAVGAAGRGLSLPSQGLPAMHCGGLGAQRPVGGLGPSRLSRSDGRRGQLRPGQDDCAALAGDRGRAPGGRGAGRRHVLPRLSVPLAGQHVSPRTSFATTGFTTG